MARWLSKLTTVIPAAFVTSKSKQTFTEPSIYKYMIKIKQHYFNKVFSSFSLLSLLSQGL